MGRAAREGAERQAEKEGGGADRENRGIRSMQIKADEKAVKTVLSLFPFVSAEKKGRGRTHTRPASPTPYPPKQKQIEIGQLKSAVQTR